MEKVRYFRKIIRIAATDTPNVRLALAQKAAGKKPTHENLLPGIITYADYLKRRALWDAVEQCIKLDGLFYEGAAVLLFPPAWLDNSALVARALEGRPRRACAVGVDPAEGGDYTVLCAIDDFGVVELLSRRTPDTSVIRTEIVAFLARHAVDPKKVAIDRGGGGRQIADELRRQGYPVQTVAFGESVQPMPKRGINRSMYSEKVETREDRTTYKNRRAQMYGHLSILMDPHHSVDEFGPVFAIPANLSGNPGDPRCELRHQLAPIPKTMDAEGQLVLLPKNNPADPDDNDTLIKLIGHSPDEADALVLAVYARDLMRQPMTATTF